MPYELDPAATRPWAPAYKRREPQGDAGDRVTVRGLQGFGTADPAANAVYLVVSPLEFGAVPAAWDSATALFELEDFAREYAAADAAELETWRLQQHAASLAADEINGKDKDRVSPWAYAQPAARRTSRTKPDDAARTAHVEVKRLEQERERLAGEVEGLEKKVER